MCNKIELFLGKFFAAAHQTMHIKNDSECTLESKYLYDFYVSALMCIVNFASTP